MGLLNGRAIKLIRMETSFIFFLVVIFLAFVFDFTNGFHDASNSIATIVATKMLTPKQAVLWTAFFNFIAFLFFKLSVANTIGAGLIRPDTVNSFLIFSALISAIAWNMITWFYGLPSSSSHALIGGLAGAALAKGGIHVLELTGFTKVIIAIILSPLIGLILGLGLTLLVNALTHHNHRAVNHRWFKRIQFVSSALLSLTHGSNDAQKTMGIIAVLLYSNAFLGTQFYVPFWVIISCHFVIALGTLAGGWRIVHTLAKKITHLNTLRACCAETSAAVTILTATHFGVPVSTTHTVTGSIAGAGLSQSFWGTQWSMMHKIFLAWIFTIPATGIIAALLMLVMQSFGS